MRNLSAFFLCLITLNVVAQIPSGYYDAGWTFVNANDLISGDDIWDIYSDIPSGTPSYTFTPGTDQCGIYSNEGGCYNLEHSVPKSWFSDACPMDTDFHHLYPTDGYVNGQRGNHPFGEVGSVTYTSSNGSKVGSSSIPGYSGTVFEPIDEYKGDLARTYF